MKSAVFSTFLATMLVLVGLSAASKANPIVPIHNADSMKAVLIRDWERAKTWTREYLEAMPARDVNFKPASDVRSFAEQMLHLAQGNIRLSSGGTGRPPLYANVVLEKEDSLKNKEALIRIVMESYDFAIEGLRAMDASRFHEIVKRGNFEFSRLGWIMKAFEHQTHHRGQSVIYLRLKGVQPPNARILQ